MNKMKHTVIMNLLLFIGLDPQNSVWATIVNNGDMESLHVMVVVPTPNGDSCLQPKWERGEEIIPGAHIAVNEINDSPNLLSTYQLEIVPINIQQCNPVSKIKSFVGNFTSQNNKLAGIVGYFCDNLVHFFSRLVGRSTSGTIQISAAAMPAIIPNKDHSVPGLYNILPSPFVLVKTVAKLIRKLRLSKVGIVNKGVYHDVHYSRMTEAFLRTAQEHDITIEFQMEGDLAKSPLSLGKLRESSAKLIVVFLPPSEACLLYTSPSPRDATLSRMPSSA